MSMSNGIGAYGGIQNGGNTPQLRPQFRRQGSSFGHGNVHNMAVMVVPTKVDYSVTKGGVRLWAVLFVFIFLCSAMLTVFTEIDDDDDDHPVSSSAFDEDETENEKNVKTPRIVEDEDLEDDGEAANPPDRGPSASSSTPSEIITAADEDEEEEEPQEEELFAKLREKAAKQSARRQRKEVAARKAAAEENGNEEEAAPVKQSRRRRKQKEVEVEKAEETVEVEAEEVQEDENDAIVEEPKQKRKSRRRKKVEVIEDRNDDDDDESETIVVEETHPEAENDNDDEKSASASDKYNNNDNDNDDDDENEGENESQQSTSPKPPSKHNPIKSPKKKAASWRRNVLSEDNPAPRKNLLKHTKRRQKAAYPQGDENIEEDEEENDDDENNDNENEEDEAPLETAEERMQTHDVVSIRKKSPQYNRKAITNRDDFKHRNRLDTADFLLEKHEFAKAASLYDQVLSFNKESPRAHYGKARTLQLRSEFEGNEFLLDAAIAEYQIVLDDDDTPEALFRMTADNIIECARYRGNLHKVMTVQRALLDRFPDDIELQNNFGVTFLMMGRVEDARNVFSAVLETNPNDPLAQAYYGYILKVHDRDFERGVQFMRRGLRGSDEAIIDAKFYFHLGDGLMRLGRNQEALRVYEEATHLGLFPSPLQRSFHNLDGLIARPWWTLEQTGCGKHLKHVERQWTVIREEAIKLWQNYEELFEPEDLHLTEGTLVAYPITRDSTFIEENCARAPTICTILKKFVNDAGCFKGDIRVSVLQTGTRIWPHCGATNYVLEAQLGLQVTSDARIRVASDVKGWKTGKFLVYDESFEHEIWFDGASANTVRIILSMELWHPEVPQLSRADTLRP